ncbi:MAG: thermonuclease family protein [Sideroxyarcus sp.]|nr:thermonuclease family protein [Sideroxyarcus sp.]
MPGVHKKHPGLSALVALCACLAWGAQAEIFGAKVIAVLDGDTVLVLREGQKLKIRMADIDAPEVGHAGTDGEPPDSQKDQPYGRQSRDSLREMLGKKQVQIDSRAIDQYGRVIGLVSLDGRDINREQVQRGMAWATQSRRSATRAGEVAHYRTYTDLQDEARQARRGLWALPDPQTPWQWRKLHPLLVSAQSASDHAASAGSNDGDCGKKRFCSEMLSCDEARFHYTHCGLKTLDGNRDGSPCESLCGGGE